MVELRCYATICETETNGRRVLSLIGAPKRGLTRICADAFIDCTDDADVALFADARTVTSPLRA